MAALLSFTALGLATTYVYTDLGNLTSDAAAISQNGRVAGFWEGNTTSDSSVFIFYNGTFTNYTSNVSGSPNNFATGINSSGLVVGYSDNITNNIDDTTTGFIFSNPLVDISLIIPKLGSDQINSSKIFAINDAGTAVGTAPNWNIGVPNGGTTDTGHAFVYTNGAVSFLPDFKGTASEAHAINKAGQIVGWSFIGESGIKAHAFLLANGKMTDLNPLFGGDESVAVAINDKGDVLGYQSYWFGYPLGSMYLYSKGKATKLNLPEFSQPFGMNNLDQVIGEDGSFNPFLYSNGTLTYLADLTFVGPAPEEFITVQAINDAGQMVGQCISPNGHQSAYLITPSDEASLPAAGTPLADKMKLAGGNINLDPGLSGGNPLTVQWYRNGSPIAGATKTTLTLAKLQTSQTGNYSFFASNLMGNMSGNMTLTVVSPPIIGKQPVNTAVLIGKTAKLMATISGSPPLTYQWLVSNDGGSTWANVTNANGISGATSPTLIFSNTTVDENGGQYQCVVNNSSGVPATTTPVTLTVGSVPQIVVAPLNLTAIQSQIVSFNVTATGFPAPTYQWYKGKTLLSGQNTTTLAFNGVQTTDADTYSVVVTNAFGKLTSKATLKVIIPAFVSVQPSNASVAAGKSAKFAVTATGTAKITYQWQVSTDVGHSFTNIAKATANTYSIAKTTIAMNGWQFHCLVNNAADLPDTSHAATLTVN